VSWKTFGPYLYDGWLYGKFDFRTNDFVGNNAAYIYHDMTTVILGTFVNNTLIKGSAARIKYFR
jgi:hypothetical protein